jgi:hypothetical protein
VGQVPIPGALATTLGAPAGTALADVAAEALAPLSDDDLTQLGSAVASEIRRHDIIARCGNVVLPRVPLPLERLDLSRRAYNAVVWAGLAFDGELVPNPLLRFVSAPNIGATALLDILTEVERSEATMPAPQAPPADGPEKPSVGQPRPSRAVRRAVLPLLSRRWAPKVHRDDPRLGKAVRELHATAETAREAGELLQEAAVDAAEARRLSSRARSLIEQGDALRSLTVEAELEGILESLVRGEAAREIIAARLGLTGDPPVTLELAGRKGSVTRERARQIVLRFVNDLMSRSRPWTPALDRTLRTVRDSIPAAIPDIQRQLREEGLVSGAFSFESLREAARIFRRPVPFVVDDEGFVYHEGEASARQVASAARKLVTHWGATTIDALLALLEELETPTSNVMARVVVEAIPGFSWLDDDKEWFWTREASRNRLLNQIEKIMVVAGSVELVDLRNGVGRHYRMEGFRPPREVLARLCVETGLYHRDDTRIVGGPDLPDWQDVLGDIERGLVEILFEHGPVMRRDEIVELAIDQGLNRNSVGVYLTYSPVLERYAPGVWGLRGAPVSAAEIQTLIPPRVRRQVLQDHGWTGDGKLWIAYKLSPAAIETGVLGTPAVMRDVAKGPFPLSAEGGRLVGTLVIEENMWGLSPFFRRWGVEAGDYLVLVLNLQEHTATIAAGEEDLLLRYQAGE